MAPGGLARRVQRTTSSPAATTTTTTTTTTTATHSWPPAPTTSASARSWGRRRLLRRRQRRSLIGTYERRNCTRTGRKCLFAMYYQFKVLPLSFSPLRKASFFFLQRYLHLSVHCSLVLFVLLLPSASHHSLPGGNQLVRPDVLAFDLVVLGCRGLDRLHRGQLQRDRGRLW